MRRSRPRQDIEPDSVPGVATLDSTSVEKILEAGHLVHIPEGWTPIRAHEPADEAYLILDGCVEVVDGEQLVADVCRGEFFGEMALVHHSLRNARVTVVNPVLAIAWAQRDFQRLRDELSDFDQLVTRTAEHRTEANAQREADSSSNSSS